MNEFSFSSEDLLQRFRVRLVRGFMVFAATVATLTYFGKLIGSVPTSFSEDTILVMSIVAWLLLGVSLWRRAIPALYTFIPLLLALASFSVGDTSNRLIILLIASALAGIMLSRAAFMLVLALVVFNFTAVVFQRLPEGFGAGEFMSGFFSLIVYMVVPIAVGSVTFSFTQVLRQALDAARNGVGLLENSAGIGGLFSQVNDERLLSSIAVESIQQNIKADHVQVFLTSEDGENLQFVAGTGAGEMNLLSSLYALPLSSDSALARAAKTREVIVVRGSSMEYERQRSSLDLLPTTRTEFIFPIRDQNQILGVIDLQNSRDALILELEVKALQILINQFAAALQNARLFHDQERNLLENKRLFLEAQARLRENEELNKRLTRDLWSQYLNASKRASGVTLDHETLRTESAWTQRMQEASRRKRPVRETSTNQQTIALPIELRGEVIGAVEIETTNQVDYESTVELMHSVSQRLANSLETARLFEVERDASIQEQRLSDLVSQYQSAATVDELLQITLKELATTLGAEAGSIRLGLMDQVELPSASVRQPQGGDPA